MSNSSLTSSPARSSISTTAIAGANAPSSLNADEFHFPADLISVQDRKDEALVVLKSDVMAALNKELKSLDEDNWMFEAPRSRIHLISRPDGLGRGGRGRGNARNNRRFGHPANRNPARQNGPPQPRNLATTYTAYRNDPLWTTSAGGRDLEPEPGVLNIYPGCEGFMDLVHVLHASCASASSNYLRRVSETALQYFCAVFTYYRLLSVHSMNGYLITNHEQRFVEQIHALNLEIPGLLAMYLQGFGNTRAPFGRDYLFRMYPRNGYHRYGGVPGYFGMCNTANQPIYQNYPCIAVFASKLQYEVSPAPIDPNWDIPGECAPEILGSQGAGTAVMGFNRACILSAQQREFYLMSGIYHDRNFPTDNPSIALNFTFLRLIAAELSNVSGMKMCAVPSSITGSQAQLVWIDMTREGEHIVRSGYNLPAEISMPAGAFKYRIRRGINDAYFEGTEKWAYFPWMVWAPMEIVNPEPGADIAGAYAEWRRMAAAGDRLREFEHDILQCSGYRSSAYLPRSRLEMIQKTFMEKK